MAPAELEADAVYTFRAYSQVGERGKGSDEKRVKTQQRFVQV